VSLNSATTKTFGVLSEFKEFILRGNVLELAVAVVIGVAFNAVVNSMVEDVLTPLIAVVVGEPDFSNLSIVINDSRIKYGNFLNQLISFFLVAAAIFFLIIKPINVLMRRLNNGEEETPDTVPCPECTEMIKRKATRCPHCTTEIKLAQT
jgi:large conductance mechanosensitive channel